MSVNPDFRDLFAALNDAKADYLLVGGYAVAFHSQPRFTKDLDIWVEPHPGFPPFKNVMAVKFAGNDPGSLSNWIEIPRNKMKMTRSNIIRLVISIAVFATCAELSAGDSSADAKVPFKEARLIIEFNATAEDAGVQLFLDAEDWKTIDIFDPNGNLIFEVDGRSKLRRLGMTELFFESVEPSINDLPLQDFLALFPEGEYKFIGKTIAGDTLVGTVPFSHLIPDGPSVNGPKKKDVVDPQNTVISWDPVVTPAGVEIVRYEVIVEGGKPQRNFDVFVPGSVTSVTVSPEFLEPDAKYIFEVLAIEANGNQTITEGAFRTQ